MAASKLGRVMAAVACTAMLVSLLLPALGHAPARATMNSTEPDRLRAGGTGEPQPASLSRPSGTQAGTAGAAPNSPAHQDDPLAKIEPLVLEEVSAAGQTEFFIWMKEKADLRPADQLRTKEEKGRFVFEALRRTAERSQQTVRAELDRQGIDYRPFYIANKILVRGGNQTLLLGVASLPDVARITANHKIQLVKPIINPRPEAQLLAVESNLSFVNADDAWASGYTGSGTVLAGNDTGLDWDHPALIRQYRGWNGVTADHNYNWWDATHTYPNVPNDGDSHGTHTTGTMVGDDGAGNRIGVAPGARTIHCKNLDDYGSGTEETITECFEWDLAPWDLAGANPRPDLAPDAINNSWGGYGGDRAFQDEIAALVAAGILVEASAGNSGPGCSTLGSPGSYRQVLTTGSVDHAGGSLPGVISEFSSRGPSELFPNSYIPDVLAPGENIRSSVPGGGYQGGWTGTSMSGPHVVGLVGLMWSSNPRLRGQVQRTISIIQQTAVPLAGETGSNCGGDYNQGPNNDWGHGTIDALAAVQQATLYGANSRLAGTVTDGTVPVPDATIRASLSPTQTWQTTSNALGNYTLRVWSGTYTMTTSAYGYYPATLTGVSAVSGTTTTVNITLTPAETYVVSGAVTDANTGWGIHASIDIDGYPGGTLWTDPVSGAYSVTLAAGTSYTFRVDAANYAPSTRPVGPLTGDETLDIALQPDASGGCPPGYQGSPFFVDSFESWTIGPTWSITTTPTGRVQVSEVYPYLGRRSVLLDNYYEYSYNAIAAIILTRDLSAHKQVYLDFWWREFYDWDDPEDGVFISDDDGAHWYQVLTFEGDPETFRNDVIDIGTAAAANGLTLNDHFKIKFQGYVAEPIPYGGYAIDEVQLGTCVLATGGRVVGRVYDANTGQPLAGALIESDSGQSTATDGGGGYTLFEAPGRHTLTATMGSAYGSDRRVVRVRDGQTVQRDFSLPAGWLSYAPPSLEAALDIGASQSATLTLTNQGALAANWEIEEIDGGYRASSLPAVQVPGYRPLEALAKESPSYAVRHLVSRESWSYQPSTRALLSSTSVDVLLVAAADATQIQAILQAYPDINLADYFDARLATPTLAQLLAYHTTIVMANSAFADPAALGDVLADYVDAGGSVVQVVPTFYGSGWGLEGRFVAEGYSPFVGMYDVVWPADLGPFDPSHPIMRGVTLAADSLRQAVDLSDGAHWVASWSDGHYFIATKGQVVALNTFLADGFAWTGDIDLIVHNSIVWLNQGAVPWLSEEPYSGALAPNGSTRPIDVTFDATLLEEPGEYYAQLRFNQDTPYSPETVPVTMTVSAPAAWGKLAGTVHSLGHCDANPAPLEGAEVLIEASDGVTWTRTTPISGTYHVWLDEAHSPLTITVAYPNHATGQATGVAVTGQMTTTQDFDLRLIQPCVAASPAAIGATLDMGQAVTRAFTLTNNGAAPVDFVLKEVDYGVISPRSLPADALHTGGRVRASDEAKQAEPGASGDAAFPLAGGGPDPFGYTYRDSHEADGPIYQWIEIAPPAGGSGTSLNMSGTDEGYFWPLSLPFGFNFYGTNYTELAISSNGALYFIDSWLPYNNYPIPGPTGSEIQTFIAPFWDDLVVDPGELYYQVVGSMLILEYYRVSGFFSDGNGTWQVILFRNGSMLFQYQDATVGTGRDYGVSATVGIQGDTQTGLQYSFDIASLSDAFAICFAYPGAPPDCSQDVPWLSIDPITGTLAADVGLQRVNVVLNTSVLDESGQYSARLDVFDKGRANTVAGLPITLTVPAGPMQLYIPFILKPAP